ncbi:hypothetical protein [Streptomyces hydrogenans]|uniref:hypothetical protein n=1 Tax=Streptomyces hydrogenans TaxID=1873719 RepID=UPI0038227C3B
MTSWVEDHSLEAPDGHVWMRPVDDCPNCPCCTRRLCSEAAERTDPVTGKTGIPCSWLVGPDAFDTVRNCPCESNGEAPEKGEPETSS